MNSLAPRRSILNSANFSGRTLPDSVADLIQMLRMPKDCDNAFLADMQRGQAASALGKLGDAVAVPALIEALKDPNYVCTCSALSLAKLKHPDAVAPLVAALQDDNKFWVARGAAAVALGQLGACARSALPALRRALHYSCRAPGETWDKRAREAVRDAIAHIADPAAPCALTGKGLRYEMWGLEDLAKPQ